jgi:predicted TIM-barrel fold metal-dependent hydrolase
VQANFTQPFSADSHTIETPDVYRNYASAKFKDRAPRLVHDDEWGAMYAVEGIAKPVPIGRVCMADVPAADRYAKRARPFSEMPAAGYRAKERLAAQDHDGITGEVIYPTAGMVLCQHADADYRYEMLWAYNRWLQEFTSEAGDRLIGIPQLAVRSVDDAIKELKDVKRMGFRGAMLPGDPATEEDYDDPSFDRFWAAAVALDLPLSFHSLTSGRAGNVLQKIAQRGSSPLAGLTHIVRSNQDMINMMIFGGVFDRFPDLKLVCVEADASWAPHAMMKMDQYSVVMRDLVGAKKLSRRPSEMFKHNIYMTFQYDWLAFHMTDFMNPDRLMWANDFPHTDGTWPNSRQLLAENLPTGKESRTDRILSGNVKRLYGLA